jgi:cob(I)alamin adenosyltransferase
LKDISRRINSGEYDLVILDEANIALFYNLFTVEKLIEIISSRPEKTEVIITGRYAPQELIDHADLVTEMKEVKHYYNEGVEAREGIEY